MTVALGADDLEAVDFVDPFFISDDQCGFRGSLCHG